MRPTLDIFLGSTRVGTITNLSSDHNAFVFDDTYIADEARPVLSLGFYNVQGDFSPHVRIPQLKLLPFFANLLPEGHLREYLARRAHVNPQRDFPLLWLLGEDLPGAVIARHPDGAVFTPDEMPAVIDEAVERDPEVLKFSLAGVQLKFSAVLEAENGLTIPIHGKGGDWIAKMPSATYPNVPENEFTMLSFARRLGIDVPEIGLINAADIQNMPPEVRTDLGNAMYIKRFDRAGDHRIHSEDFAQIFGLYPTRFEKYRKASYANMLAGIWQRLGQEQTEEFIRRLVFSIAIGNGDMHVKNWSIIYPDGRTPRLAPAYDYVSTIVYMPNDDLGLSVARTKDYEQLDMARFESMARRAGVPRGVVMRAARDMAERINGEWRHINDADLLPRRIVAAIERHRERVPLLNGRKAQAVDIDLAAAPPEAQQHEIA